MLREQKGTIQDLDTDPTLQRSEKLACPKCGNKEYVSIPVSTSAYFVLLP